MRIVLLVGGKNIRWTQDPHWFCLVCMDDSVKTHDVCSRRDKLMSLYRKRPPIDREISLKRVVLNHAIDDSISFFHIFVEMVGFPP